METKASRTLITHSFWKHVSIQHCGHLSLWECLKTNLCPAEKGIKLVQEGQYAQAASMFTEAIKCDPKDYRYSFCGHDLGITKEMHISHNINSFIY